MTNDAATVSLSWRGIALASAMLGLASLATLAVVVSIKDLDALSTVALVLAILAFVVQLIVYIVQAADTSRQSAQSQELHAQMMSVMAQIQERTQGTQQSVDRMNTRLLEAVIGKAASEGVGVSSPEFAQLVAREVSRTNRQSRLETSDSSVHDGHSGLDWPGPLDARVAAPLYEEMTTWPDSEKHDEVTELLENLPDAALLDLYSLADDLRRNTRPGAGLGPGLAMLSDDQVISDGLAEKVPGWNLYTLSPKGRLLGRVLTAEGTPPPSFEDLLPLRDQVARLVEERNARLALRRSET